MLTSPHTSPFLFTRPNLATATYNSTKCALGVVWPLRQHADDRVRLLEPHRHAPSVRAWSDSKQLHRVEPIVQVLSFATLPSRRDDARAAGVNAALV